MGQTDKKILKNKTISDFKNGSKEKKGKKLLRREEEMVVVSLSL